MSSLPSNSYLPSEILHIIFDYLENDDLHLLFDVSPRFCYLSLTIYFARRKVTISPDGQIDLPNHGKAKEMLPLIPKARFVTSINRLWCGFFHPDKSFLKNIYDLTAVLKHVKSVKELELNLFSSGRAWTPTLIKRINAGNALVKALGELFMAAAQVSRSLIVYSGPSLRSVIQKVEKGGSGGNTLTRKLSLSFRPISRLFSSDNLRGKWLTHHYLAGSNPAPPKSTSPPLSAKGALRSLEINSFILLTPPFLDWCIHTLNCNDVTELTFGTIEFRDVNWSSLLPQIRIPALKKVAFRGYTPFGDLVAFMARHDHITALAVNHLNFEDWVKSISPLATPSTPSPCSEPSCDACVVEKLVKAFAKINKLTCSPQGFVHLFSGALLPTNPKIELFPNLRTVIVFWSIGLGQPVRMSAVADILAPISHRLKSYKKAKLLLMYRADVGSSWLSCPPPALPEAPVGCLQRTVALPYSTDLNSMTGQAKKSRTPIRPATSLFNIFTEIKLEVTPRADKDGVPALAKALADNFTNISKFKVDTRARAGRPPQENKQMKLYLCHHVLKQFTSLRVVYIDGVKSKVVERESREPESRDLPV
jgi:hypothetical protein